MSFAEWSNKKKKKDQQYNSFADWSNAKQGITEEEKESALSWRNDEIAPVKEEKEEERTWFTSGAFDDGYQFGDVSKTIVDSTYDVLRNVAEGIIGIAEPTVDTGAYIVGGIGGLFSDDFKSGTENFIKNNLIDEEAVAKFLIPGISDTTHRIVKQAVLKDADAFGGTEKAQAVVNAMEKDDSIFGEKTDSLVNSAGQLGAQMGLQALGVPWQVTTGVTSFGSGVEGALNDGATYGEAGLQGAIQAGADILTESLFKGSGLGEEGLINLGGLTKDISNKAVKALFDYGIDITAEGTEEVAAKFFTDLGSALYKEENLKDILWNEKSLDEYLESFIGGAFLSGVSNAKNVYQSAKNKTDYNTGLNANDEKVLDKVFNDAVKDMEAEKGESLTAKEKNELKESLMEKMDKGYISIDTIEETLGGDTYKAYKESLEQDEAKNKELEDLKAEYDTLYKMKNMEKSDEQIDRQKELKGIIDGFNLESNTENLKAQLSTEVEKLATKGVLAESYNERARKGEAFTTDLSQYKGKQRAAVERAIKSGVLNNTNRSHELVNILSKIEADKGIAFDFTNNEKLKESGFAVEGKTVNGFVKNGAVTLNVQSAKAWQSTVGHEVTHVLEGTEAYGALQKSLFAYAKSKGELDSRRASLTETYKNIDADIDAELTADLVGDYLFNDKNFIKDLTTDRNLFQKIYDEIKYLCKIATGKELTEIEKVRREFDKAWKELSVNTNAETDGKTKYSIVEPFTDKEGNHYENAVLLDTDVFDDVSPRNWWRTLKTYLEQRVDKSTFIMPVADENGNLQMLEFAKSNEYVGKNGSSEHRVLGELYKTKDNISKLSAIHIDEIVEVSESDAPYHTQADGHGWLDANGWLHRTANVINARNGNIYNITMDIAKTEDGRTILYALKGKTKKIGNAEVNSLVTKGTSGASLNPDFKNTLPQNAKNVKYSVSSDSNGTQLTDGQREYFKDSKAVDDDGNLLVLYHGTSDGGYTVFDPKYSDDKRSIFLTDDIQTANSYIREQKYHDKILKTPSKKPDALKWLEGDPTKSKNKKGLYKVYANIKNPLVVDCKGSSWNEIPFGKNDVYEVSYADGKVTVKELNSGKTETQAFTDAEIEAEVKPKEYFEKLFNAEEAERLMWFLKIKPKNATNRSILGNFTWDGNRVTAGDSTRSISAFAKKQGYDGVIFKNVRDYGTGLKAKEIDAEGAGKNVYIVFDSNQIKDVNNTNPTTDPDIRYSISEDSEGTQLSKEQQEYFKDSKVVDENGNLKVMYHGTPNATFTVFKSGTYFTENKEYADVYQGQGASSLGYKKTADNPDTYAVYLDIKKPFDTRNKTERDIFYNEYYRQWGTGTDLMESGLPDWLDGQDLQEFLEENGYDYDGLILDEGATGGYGEEVVSRGLSYVVFSPEQVKLTTNKTPTADPDIRFSLSETVEETKDLIAVHNLSEEKLLKSLELGGLPMPSIAIARAKEGHSGFGNISLVFGKDVIDPQNERSNKVYSGDAWTPTYPRIDHKVDAKSQAEVEERINNLISENVAKDLGGLHIDSYNIEQELNRNNGSITEVFRNNTALKYAFLVENGNNLELPTKNKRLAKFSNHPDEAIIRVAENISEDKLRGIWQGKYSTEQIYEIEAEMRNAINEYFKEKYQKLPPNALEALLKKETMSRGDIDDYAREALDYLKNGVVQEIDYSAAKTLINETIDTQKYENWVKDLFANIVEKEGIRNNKDIFTPSGNRRSFEALHYEHNLENVIKAMRESGEKGIGTFGRGSIFGASTTEFKSIADIKNAANTRLQNISQEEYEAIRKGFSERFFELAYGLPVHKDSYTATDSAANMLVEAVAKFKTKSGIANYLRKESEGWANYSDYVVDDLMQLVEEIRQMPTSYFEAKPQRAVGFDEVATAIIPDNTSAELKQMLTDYGIKFVEYENGNEQSRVDILNSLEETKFSLSKQGEQITPSGNYSTPMNELALAPTQEDISAMESTTTEDAPTEETPSIDLAPLPEDAMYDDAPLPSDFDVPPVMEDNYYAEPDTTPISENSLKFMGDVLRKKLNLTASDTKAMQEIIQEYATSENPNKAELLDKITKRFGETVTNEKDIDLSAIKKHLRETPLYIDDAVKNNITDWSDFRKRLNGKIKFVQNPQDGFYLDKYYEHLVERYPDAFHLGMDNEFGDLGNHLNQLQKIESVVNKKVFREKVDTRHTEDLQNAVDTISNAVNEYKQSLTRKAAQDTAREALDSIAPLKATQLTDGSRSDALLNQSLDNHPVQTVEQKVAEKIRALEANIADLKQLRREAWQGYESQIEELSNTYGSLKNTNTKKANNIITRVPKLERLKASNDANYAKRISDLEARLEKMQTDEYNRAMHKQDKMQGYADWVANLLGDTTTWKDKKTGLQYSTNTEHRNLRDIVRDANGNKDIAKADAIYDATMGEYNRNQAAKNRKVAEVKKAFADMNITKAESTYIQMLGEFRHNPETTLTEEDVKKYYEKHKNKIDTAKVDNAIELARQTYDNALTELNAKLKEQGMKEIPYRKGYFPHFTEPKQNFIQKLFNWKTQDTEIPTSIAGLTEEFKPNKSWQTFDKQRHSDETDYNFLKGLDSYLEGAYDWIYHLEDIQKRRAIENHIRYTHSEEGIKAKIKEVYADETLDADEAQAKIEQILGEAKNPLNNFVQDYMTHTNILTNKKNSYDRGMEQALNRKIYSTMTNVQNRVSANMVLANVRSALTNFIPITQSWAQVSPLRSVQATKDVIKNAIKDDGLINKSTFLTNRLKEADNLYKDNWDKVLDKAGIMFEVVDNFSSQVIWRSKYNDNLAKGMTEAKAIENADQFAENVMAGRSKGNEPTLFNAKNPLVKAFTMFQLEVNNQYGYFFKDVPTDLKAETNHWKLNMAKGYTTAFLGAYAYNALLEQIAGSGAALDPIGIIEDVLRDLGLFDDDEEKEPTEVVTNLIENVGGELPFVGGTLFGGGRIPISSAMPYGDDGLVNGIGDFVSDVSEGNWGNVGKEMMNPLLNVGLPVGGGQLKKTTQGLGMFNEEHPIAGSYTDSGDLRFPVEDTTANRIQAAIFGQWANENARNYIENGRKPLSEKQTQEFIDVEMPIADYWKYRDGLKGLKKNEEKADYINSLDIEDWQKNLLMNNILDRKEDVDMSNYDDFADWEEFDYAQKNPEKYAVAKSVGGYSSYKSYSNDLNDIKADKDINGNSISGSRKQKVLNYINNLDADYETKLILFKSEYPSDDTYNAEIINYINNRSDLTYEERVNIFAELGFKVIDGQIYY